MTRTGGRLLRWTLVATTLAIAAAAPIATASDEPLAAAEEPAANEYVWPAEESCLSLVSFATVTTDQDDYAPGSTVGISGSGFGAECAYELRVVRPDGVVEAFEVLSGPDGEVAHAYLLPPPPGVIGEYLIEVVGAGDQVVAAVRFTDAVAFENSAQNANASTSPLQSSLTIPNPENTEVGDFLIAQVSVKDSTNAICAPAGWTSILKTVQGSDVTIQTFRKFATAADAAAVNFQFTFRSNSGSCGGSSGALLRTASGGIIRYTGVHPTDPIQGTSAATGDTDEPTASSISNVPAGARVIAFFGIKGGPPDQSLSFPAGTNVPFNVANENSSDGPTSATRDDLQVTAGATGTRSADAEKKEKWAAQLIALRPELQLEFITPPRTGAVGQCLGPITVRTHDDSGATTPVRQNTQVNLATDGSGTFHPTNTCGTASVAAVTIANGQSFATFFYKATAAGTGSHAVTASGIGLVSASQTQTIQTPAPVLTAPADQTADEGTDKSFNLGSFTDAGDPGPWTVSVNWGDGSGTETFSAATAGNLARTHIYADDGLYTVTVTVTDSSSQSDSETFKVTVANVAPSVTAPADQTAGEGESTPFSLGSFTDPGADSPWTVTVDWGDDSEDTTFARSSPGIIPAQDHTYADNGSYTVSVTVAEPGGIASDTETFTVDVANVAPTVTLDPENTLEWGESTTVERTFAYSVGDPGDDTWTTEASCGDGGELVADSDDGSSFKCVFADGPATPSVSVTATDEDGESGSDSQDVTVNNVGPTVVLAESNTLEFSESTTAERSFAYSVSDPGDDTWTTEASCGVGGELVADSDDGSSFKCVFADGPATPSVSVTATDEDGDAGSDSQDVTVNNVAPTVELDEANTLEWGESTTAERSFAYSVSDPGDDEWTTAASCGVGGELVADSDDGSSFKCVFADGPATPSVSVTATDEDGDAGSDSQDVTVNNVAPTATFANDGPVDEGDSFTLSLSAASDPSAADTAAGFEYAFDCGDGAGYGAFGAEVSAECATTDDGERSVGGKIRDKDGGLNEYTGTVTVENVAPSVTAAADQEADEGESVSFELGSFTDPGPDSPWTVTVDWGDGSSVTSFTANAPGAIEAKSHTYSDNGVYTVSVTVTDKDDEASTAGTFDATVHNVAPTITSFTGTDYLHGPLAFTGGGSAYSVFTTVFDDPGTVDTHSAYFEYEDGEPLTETVAPFVSGQTVKHRFASAGCDKSATVKVTDNDGDYDTAATTVDVGSGSFLPPMTNQPVTDKLRNGQVLPVKIRVADCAGAPMASLSPTIKLVAGDQTAVSEHTEALIDPASVSAADTTGVMRHSGGGDYIYNMKVQLPLSTKYTVVIYPFGGTSGPRLAHVIEATK